jgi:hypothetical protein
MWTIQETVLASKALVVCGNAQMSWEDFGFSIIVLENKEVFKAIFLNLLGYWWTWHFLRYHASHGEDRIDDVVRYARSKSCANARDKVYGLYGVFEKLGATFPEVDYAKPVEEIYNIFTRVIIQESNRRQALEHTGEHPTLQQLPSWVLDWSVESIWLLGWGSKFKASRDSALYYQFSEDCLRLSIKGKIIKTIWPAEPLLSHIYRRRCTQARLVLPNSELKPSKFSENGPKWC